MAHGVVDRASDEHRVRCEPDVPLGDFPGGRKIVVAAADHVQVGPPADALAFPQSLAGANEDIGRKELIGESDQIWWQCAVLVLPGLHGQPNLSEVITALNGFRSGSGFAGGGKRDGGPERQKQQKRNNCKQQNHARHANADSGKTAAGKAAMALANLAERDKAQNPAQHGSDPAREKSENSQNQRGDGQAAGFWRTMDSRH